MDNEHTVTRLALDQETSQVQDLWTYCFDDSPEFVDFFFHFCYKPKNTLVTVEGNRVCSCLQLLPYRMQLRGRPVDVSYIVGVATRPEYRGRGHAARLLQYADTILRKRNIHCSVLLPFQYDFYRKYGWEICYDLLTYREMEEPKYTGKITGTYQRLEICDIKALSDCYLHFMKGFHGYLIRNQNDWEKILRDLELDHGIGFRYLKDNITTGYILYTLRDKELCIHELLYQNPEAKEALIRLAFHHMGQVSRISWKAPSADTTYLSMKDSRGKLEKETFVMGRIHNIIGALSGIPFSGDPFVLRVSDPMIQSNNGCYFLKEKSSVLNITATGKEPDVQMDIRTLTQLLWGFCAADFSLEEGRLKCREEREERVLTSLSALFPPKNNFMTEEY